MPSIYLFRNNAKILRTQHIRVGEEKCLLMLTQLINRQRGWQGGDQQHMIMSPSGATEGKAQAEPDNPGRVTFTVAQDFGFQCSETNSSKMSGLSQVFLLELVTARGTWHT